MGSDFFTNAFNALSNTEFEQIPVSVEIFCESEDYMDLPPLSENQYRCIKASTQIYKLETLISLFGEDEGHARFRQTNNEIILQLGKSSGKDEMSAISCAYVVYQLLCLKDPARYYGKPSGNAIDILNIAINARQAADVFFKRLRTRIKGCQWFDDKYVLRAGVIEFDKNITVYSGHSEREAWEGYEAFYVVLDEISGFALESNTGNDLANTAQATYNMYRASVNSRFSDFGKLVLLSWPRFKDDFIQQRYNAVIADKETIIKTHTFKRDPDLPDGVEGNEFTIEWEEDHIVRYLYRNVFALKRPTWDMNPTKYIDSYCRDFDENPSDTYGRVACMPQSSGEDNFFKNHQAIEEAFITLNAVDNDGMFLNDFKPKDNTDYFIHVDLAQKKDNCAVALAHVDSWVQVNIGGTFKEAHPVVKIDLIRWWTPTKIKTVDFDDVRDFIVGLRTRGFNIKLITFDRWGSNDMINYLNLQGMKSELLSVAKKHYDDFLSVMYGHRLIGPHIPLLIDELKELKLIKDKIDHPRKGKKDLSDAAAGAIFNAVAYTPRPASYEVNAFSLSDMYKKQRQAQRDKIERERNIQGLIVPPKRGRMPDDVKQYLSMPRILGYLPPVEIERVDTDA